MEKHAKPGNPVFTEEEIRMFLIALPIRVTIEMNPGSLALKVYFSDGDKSP